VEEDDVDSGFCLIYDGIVVCQQYLLARQIQSVLWFLISANKLILLQCGYDGTRFVERQNNVI